MRHFRLHLAATVLCWFIALIAVTRNAALWAVFLALAMLLGLSLIIRVHRKEIRDHHRIKMDVNFSDSSRINKIIAELEKQFNSSSPDADTDDPKR